MEESAAQKIMDAAVLLFAQKGYAAVSVREILKKAEMSNVGAVSYYFGGKQELYTAVIDRYFAMVHAWREQLEQSDLEPPERLLQIVSFLQYVYGRHRDMLRIIFNEVAYPTGEFPHIKKHIERIQKSVLMILRQGMEMGIFRKDLDVPSTALMFLGMLHFVCAMKNFSDMILPEGEDRQLQYFRHSMENYFRAILVEPERAEAICDRMVGQEFFEKIHAEVENHG